MVPMGRRLTLTDKDRSVLDALKRLQDQPLVTPSDISKVVNISRQTTQYCLDKLVTMHFVERRAVFVERGRALGCPLCRTRLVKNVQEGLAYCPGCGWSKPGGRQRYEKKPGRPPTCTYRRTEQFKRDTLTILLWDLVHTAHDVALERVVDLAHDRSGPSYAEVQRVIDDIMRILAFEGVFPAGQGLPVESPDSTDEYLRQHLEELVARYSKG